MLLLPHPSVQGWTLTESGYRLKMGEFQRLHEMQLTLRGSQIDTTILYAPGPRRGTVRKIVIEHGTLSTPAASLRLNVPG